MKTMKMKTMKLSVLALILSLVFFTNCGDDDNEAGTAKISVALIDAPADFEFVIIDVQDIQVNVSSDENDENGWQSLEEAQPGAYDLLLLTNGEEAFMGEIELPEGKLGQVRLILGDVNSLGVAGDTVALTVPSGSQSGLKINVNADIVSGVTYKLVIDFDAAMSVVKAGNSGQYNLKPVVRANMEAQTGAIQGVVAPAEIPSVVYAVAGQDSTSSYPDENGEFLIRALPAGTYDVVGVPTASDSLSTALISGVSVVMGEVTDIDSLIFTN
jgi:hypothetical protein